jgi:hypothetical protein
MTVLENGMCVSTPILTTKSFGGLTHRYAPPTHDHSGLTPAQAHRLRTLQAAVGATLGRLKALALQRRLDAAQATLDGLAGVLRRLAAARRDFSPVAAESGA